MRSLLCRSAGRLHGLRALHDHGPGKACDAPAHQPQRGLPENVAGGKVVPIPVRQGIDNSAKEGDEQDQEHERSLPCRTCGDR